jgi:cytochrome c biogenesis protein CcmG/thiol:disulfide interchange protein DsbE
VTVVGVLRSARSSFAPLALMAALLAGLAILPRLFPRRDAPLVGSEAPDFRLEVVANGGDVAREGTFLGLRDLRGSAVVLDFWATWCGPCRAEAPILEEVSRRWRDRGVVVVGVNTDRSDQGDPRRFALSRGLSYPIVHDESEAVSRSYEVESLPTLVVLSRTGRVLAVRTGITDDREIERLIRQAL